MVLVLLGNSDACDADALEDAAQSIRPQEEPAFDGYGTLSPMLCPLGRYVPTSRLLLPVLANAGVAVHIIDDRSNLVI